MFLKLPVRRMSHPKPTRTLELVRREIEMFALACPNVGFTLENTAMGLAGGSTRDRDPGKVLTLPAVRDANIVSLQS